MSYAKAMKHHNNPRKWRRTRTKDGSGMSAAGRRGNELIFGGTMSTPTAATEIIENGKVRTLGQRANGETYIESERPAKTKHFIYDDGRPCCAAAAEPATVRLTLELAPSDTVATRTIRFNYDSEMSSESVPVAVVAYHTKADKQRAELIVRAVNVFDLLVAVARDAVEANSIDGPTCPSCGRDNRPDPCEENREYDNVCTADDCPGVMARAALSAAEGEK